MGFWRSSSLVDLLYPGAYFELCHYLFLILELISILFRLYFWPSFRFILIFDRIYFNYYWTYRQFAERLYRLRRRSSSNWTGERSRSRESHWFRYPFGGIESFGAFSNFSSKGNFLIFSKTKQVSFFLKFSQCLNIFPRIAKKKTSLKFASFQSSSAAFLDQSMQSSNASYHTPPSSLPTSASKLPQNFQNVYPQIQPLDLTPT